MSLIGLPNYEQGVRQCSAARQRPVAENKCGKSELRLIVLLT